MKWSDLEIIEKLGEGKAGEVLKARNNDKRTRDNAPIVAVKRYKTWVIEESGQMERIVRELHTGRVIQHPNLVQTLELVFDSHRLPALVMKFYEGPTLEDFLHERNYLVELDDIVHISLRVASAIRELHSAGIIHRDIKPANIQIVNDEPVLMDLGVVKPIAFPEQTTTGTFLGTIRYSAPEMLFGQDYDTRVDIHSLGLVISEMVQQARYLDSVSNWAELVVIKQDTWKSGRELWWNHWPSAFAKRYGLGVAHFFAHLLASTACGIKHRKADVNWVIDSLRSRIWCNTFYFSDGEFMQGEPTNIALGYKGLKRSLTEIRREVLGSLGDELKAKVRTLVEARYPYKPDSRNHYESYYGVELTESEWDTLIELHPYFTLNDSESGYKGAGWEDLGFSVDIHYCIFLLYRYSYL